MMKNLQSLIPNPQRPLPRAEWHWAVGWSAAVLLLSCVPYLIAAWLAPDGWRFAGILVNPLDGHSYLAKMRQGFDGYWLFHLTYTPEPHRGAFIFVFYLALGHLARLTGLPLIWMFHLARLAAGFALLMVAYCFILRLTPDRGERRLAFILLLTASGLGWLGVLFGAFPIDLWVPEAFTPYSLLANPHFPLGMALMVVILLEIGDSCPRSGAEWDWRAGIAALALALILPFALLTLWAVLAVWLGWQTWGRRQIPWPQLRRVALTGLLAGPIIGYDYWVSTTNPALAAWSAQNVTPAPRALDVVLGYGLVGLAAAAGGWMVVRGRAAPRPGERLAAAWAIVTLGLVYIPFNLQRRLITGLHIPLVILAALWLARSLRGLRYRRAIVRGVVGLAALGTLFVWALPLLGMLTPPDQSDTTALFFLRDDERIALKWLRENTEPDDVILASPRLGMFTPGQTGARVFYGHPFETIDAARKKAQVEAFFRGEIKMVTPTPDFIIYGPSEQALGQPEQLAHFPVAFTAGEVKIYKVTP